MLKIKLRLLKNIATEFNLSFIVLFGSQLAGRKNLKGDYDLAIFSRAEIRGDKLLELISRFVQLWQSDTVDVVILNFAHPLIQYEVATNGRLLYERERDSFDRFRWQAIQKWNDNKKFHALNSDYIKDYLMEKTYAT